MQALAINGDVMSLRRMASTITPRVAEQRLIGQTLRSIRESRDPKPSLREIGMKIGMSGAAYQKYETGETRMDADRQREILIALAADEEELELHRARLLEETGAPLAANDLREPGRAFEINIYGRARAGPQGIDIYDVGAPLRTVSVRSLLGPRSDAVEVAGESMSPWVEPGELVIFDRDRQPKRGQGCVVELRSGQMLVKQYAKTSNGQVWLHELQPEDRTFGIPMADLVGVYAITVRGG